MIALIAATLMAQGQVEGTWHTINTAANSTETRLQYFVPSVKLPKDKRSPLKYTDGEGNEVHYAFSYSLAGYGKYDVGDPQFDIKFQVFSQDRATHENIAPKVVRMLLNLWDMNFQKMSIDHMKIYNNRVVDVYLCWGGKPGGEQRFDIDPDTNGKVNTIYIYDLPSFKEPLEMAREVAHEYGHASLTPIGGFKQPEDWANGYLGEKFYLLNLRDALKANRIGTVDTMDTELSKLNDWVRKNVDPLIKLSAEQGPREELMKGTGQGAMDATNGLVLYLYKLLPTDVFVRSFKIFGQDATADGYLRAVRDAVETAGRVPLNIDPAWKNIAIWVPTGKKGKILNGTLVRREGDWSLIRPGIAGIPQIENKAE